MDVSAFHDKSRCAPLITVSNWCLLPQGLQKYILIVAEIRRSAFVITCQGLVKFACSTRKGVRMNNESRHAAVLRKHIALGSLSAQPITIIQHH